jgi:putative transposase
MVLASVLIQYLHTVKSWVYKLVLAVRVPNTSWADKQHPKYSYKLKGLEITRANQVWSTDITYIKIKGGMVYMAAIIDWYSKAVLSW